MRLTFLLGPLCLFLVLCRPAAAQEAMPTTDRDAEARALFDASVLAYENGRFADALTSLERAHALSGRPQLLYNIATCHDRLGRRAEALETYRQYLAAVADAPNRNFVEARMAVLEAELRERAPESAGAAEDTPPDPMPEETDARPSDPDHTPSATATGTRRDDGLLIGSSVAFGVGLVAGAALTATGILSLERHSALSARCPGGVCSVEDQSSIHDLRSLTITTDVMLGVSLAAAATGVTLLVLHVTSGSSSSSLACSPMGCSVRSYF
jgi:hypothetical protein